MSLFSLPLFALKPPPDALFSPPDELHHVAYLYTFFALIFLCIIVFCCVTLLFIHIVTKSNDFGDEDTSGMRKGGSSTRNIGAEFGSDIAVNSSLSMKHFTVKDVSKD